MAGNLLCSPDTCFQVNFKMSKWMQNPKKTDKEAVLIPSFGHSRECRLGESCQSKYGDILKLFLDQCPTPGNVVAIEKDFPHKMEQITQSSLTSKLKNSQKFQVYCLVRDWTRFLRHRIRKYPDSPVHTLSDSLRIYFFPLWRADLFFSGFAVEFAGCVWTVAVSGKKKLRIRKYPDTCGWGLRELSSLFIVYNITMF